MTPLASLTPPPLETVSVPVLDPLATVSVPLLLQVEPAPVTTAAPVTP